MNKSEFINILSKKLGCSKVYASKVVDAVFGCVGDALQEEDILRFVGFGTFKIQRLPKRKVKTPRSGEIVTVPAKKYVRFSPGELLKNKVNH
ncbi:HU family DNA-binding protein [Candidatus Aquarickettsia rohweri]|uniref:HU family DNA-binding protein n=1 Tax=Candidatus Aquarickettsia rohweri TaxID=2602574 RepID=A0A3R9XUG7_9RICK|nr:HU family DNA-binding protein [Candidatus Aquarickettsia rohweri]MSO14290.1 DNA-binding protein HU [Rickettsiales endosymbiont of Trichoplax sp. H2]RST71891.1 HU family DNA-binding protein [Candidatus Aquarickettsia rohweri]